MQAKDTQKKLLFKFVDEESDDYFKKSDVAYDGGDGDEKTKMPYIIGAVVVVGGLAAFFLTRGGSGDGAAAADDAAAADAGAGDDAATPDATE